MRKNHLTIEVEHFLPMGENAGRAALLMINDEKSDEIMAKSGEELFRGKKITILSLPSLHFASLKAMSTTK